jgi:hypothetical protein
MSPIVDMEFSSQLESAVRDAAGRSEVLAAVSRAYGELQVRIEERQPICVVSGKCCTGGHPAASPRRGAEGWDGTGCPFQIGKLCGVHGFRPFGCRVFFCDPTATQWQQDQYERFHGELRKRHDELGIPYFYVEWRAGLRAVGLSPQSRGL